MRLIDPMIPADVQYIRQVLQASPKVVALTGAGVNTRGGTAVGVQQAIRGGYPLTLVPGFLPKQHGSRGARNAT